MDRNKGSRKKLSKRQILLIAAVALAAVLLLSLALPLAACAADYSDLPLFYITTEDRLSTKLHSSMSTTENNVV